MYGNRGGGWRGPPPPQFNQPWGGDGPPRYPPRGGFNGGGFPDRGRGGFRGRGDFQGSGFPDRGRGGFRGRGDFQGGFSERFPGGAPNRGGFQPRHDFQNMNNPQPGPSTAPQFQQGAFQVKKEEPQDDHQFQRSDICSPHLMSGNPVVPKSEAIDLPKPSIPLQVQFKDGEPVVDDSLVLLDWYNSDLDLEINVQDMCSAKAMSKDGFAHLWAGVRATYGAAKGKVCYEVTVTNNQPTQHLENEPNPHVLRCGWSVDSTSLVLGTEALSYGYGGTGKISVSGKFISYGVRYGHKDVVGCYLDMTTDPMMISYTVNGRNLGVAFRISKAELKGQALFPHIFTKNQDFLVNFGQLSEPMCPILPNYTPIGQLEAADGLVRGTRAPQTKNDCEFIQMVGLPGAGKTFWATNHCKNYPAKKFNILGTNSLIDRMKVMGLRRQKNYSGRWDELISKCSECFNVLMRIAKQRKRNYILDQTNVYPTARSRKMKDFKGYIVKTIVVVPTNEEFQRRCQERFVKDGIEIPAQAMINMKANFVLPEMEEDYGEVFYTDLDPNQAQDLINQYNKEALDAGCDMNKPVKDYKNRNAMKRTQRGVMQPIGMMWPGTEFQRLDQEAKNQRLQQTNTNRQIQGASAGPPRSRSRSRSPINQRYAQSSSQSHTQPRLPQPVPSDSSISSRDWNQRQERSMPGNQQNYQQPMENFGQNYDNPPRGFNNDQRGNFSYSNSARGFQGGQSGQGVQGVQVGQSGYESTNQGGFGSNSRFSGPPQGYQQENPNFGAQGFGGPRFDTSQNSPRGGYQERPGYNQGGGYNRPPYNSQPNHMQNYQR